jgi:hypothetical protein
MEKLEKILLAQFVMIDRILTNCNYIFKHNKEQYKEEPVISNREYLRYIARLVSDDLIVNLYKLLKETQHHSFQKLNSKVKHLIEQEDFNFVTESKRNYFNLYLDEFDKLKEIYQELNFEGIRNKYVGHLDMNRVLIPFELEDLEQVQKYLVEIRECVHNAFYDFDLPIKEGTLNDLINDNIQLKSLKGQKW